RPEGGVWYLKETAPIPNSANQGYLLGYGFCQKFSPLRFKGGRVTTEQSPFTCTLHASRISSSWPMAESMVLSLKRSHEPLADRFSMPFLTSTRQVPHRPSPRQLMSLSSPR